MSSPQPAPLSLPPAVRLHQLEGFYYVGRHEGFTRAAEAMPYPITEPALHQQVRKLERALSGVKLLVRGPGRRMVLTPEGRALHRFVTPYFEQLPAVLRGITGGEAGELVLGTEPLYVEALAADVLARLRRRRPGAHLRLVEADVAQLAVLVARGDVDAALASVAEPPPGIAFEELGVLGLQLLVPAKHPLARRRPPLEPRHLEGHRFVVYEAGTEGRAFTDRLLGQAGVALTPAAEASSAASMRSLVRAGLGPAFVPALGDAPRRKKQKDGTVAFDLTELVSRLASLPRFGLLLRDDQRPSGLLAELVALTRARLE